LTGAGRRLARSWTGQKPYKAPPAGTLKEWHWRALARAYAAGAPGVEDYGAIGWPTWLRLIDYKWGALVEEAHRAPQPGEYSGIGTTYLIRITAAGRALYEREWARYSELYPDIEALEPAGTATVGGNRDGEVSDMEERRARLSGRWDTSGKRAEQEEAPAQLARSGSQATAI